RNWGLIRKQQFALIELDTDMSTEDEKIDAGRKLYKNCQSNCKIPIRSGFNATYVERGSYHVLSDQMQIGWHVDYLERLSPANDEEESHKNAEAAS
ncbi:MAG: ABC-three component system protein, partial [Methyloligellaceae bacterium]